MNKRIEFRGKKADGSAWVYGDLRQENSGNKVIMTNLSTWGDNPDEYRIGITQDGYKKLFLEQQLEIARLGAMRVIGLKEKINHYENKEDLI